ncbi:hypothetical protein [Pengzhenrongella sp.]|jgi:hypothetical protein|uniref:hypothetical protein n=1 Tax=Pengzhenrongella sp. TaxID=2888820 RepID=UPI002F940F04
MSSVSGKRPRPKQKPDPSGDPLRAALDALYLPLAHELRSSLRSDDPLHAEAAVSAFLGQLWAADGIDGEFPTMIIDAFIGDLATRAAPESTAALVVLAQLAPAESSRDLATRLLTEQSPQAPRPGWADAIGARSPGPVMVFADEYGDQAQLALEFTGPRRSHVLMALIDYSHLGAWCPDLFLVQDAEVLHPVMAERARARKGLSRLVPLHPAAAAVLIRRAIAATDLTHEPDVADSYIETLALALARLRLVEASTDTRAEDAVAVGEALRAAGLHATSPLEDPAVIEPAEREALVRRFLGSVPAAALADVAPDVVQVLVRLLVDYGCDLDDGRPLRVSAVKLGNFLLRWMPRQVTLDRDVRTALPPVIEAWVEFAIGLSGLAPEAVAELRAALPDLIAEFATLRDSAEGVGPARRRSQRGQ